ncbi:RraA family protein [Salinimonas chungwhensis]|uniref:RraA family protein n=1 Tax=Salinimonas chungwhensis TaxID=265425 RepID=UPI000361724D|nr:RraA family protein [Salinimonas chungwhensis]
MDIDFNSVSTCEYADALPREQFMDYAIHSLWQPAPSISGPAFTVNCEFGDHLMLHAAIYEARPGDIIVVQADDTYALAGGNVCAIAQKRGIKGFVLEGTIRDLTEVTAMQFPVFARGIIPKPGGKTKISPLNQPVNCGGVKVCPEDIVVADQEGIAVIPRSQAKQAYDIACARAQKDQGMSLDEWQQQHFEKVQSTLATLRAKEK